MSAPDAMVAALFVHRGGVYWDLPGVDAWDEARDARLYPGPWPVVAHPPCARWCRLAGLVEATSKGRLRRGEDGGCFASAVNAVRTWGGVLEHPAYSDAFAAFGLPTPSDKGGWQRGICGGWSCHIEQWFYGHLAKKATWLYAFGATELPSLRWGFTPDSAQTSYVTDGGGDVKQRKRALISWCGNHTKDGGEKRRRLRRQTRKCHPPPISGPAAQHRPVREVENMSGRQRSATPIPFRDLLLGIARTVRAQEVA